MFATELDTQVVPDFLAKLINPREEEIVSGYVVAPSSVNTIAVHVAEQEAEVQAVAHPVPTTPLTMKLVHRMIMASYIASAETSKKPKFPQLRANTSFDNVGFLGENAESLNKALRNGGRGLAKTRDYRAWIDSLPYKTPPTMRNYIQTELAEKASFVMFVRNTLSQLKKITKKKK
jgi:hypothetical protein